MLKSLKYTFKTFVPEIKCLWCGKLIPVVTTRPNKCPYCGGKIIMIYVDMEKDTLNIKGTMDEVLPEFMAIFDELYSVCPTDMKEIMLRFVTEVATGEFEEWCKNNNKE